MGTYIGSPVSNIVKLSDGRPAPNRRTSSPVLILAYKIGFLSTTSLETKGSSMFEPASLIKESNDSFAIARRLFREIQQLITCNC